MAYSKKMNGGDVEPILPFSSSPLFQWKVLLLIITITIINYLDRSAIAFAILPIQRDLHISNMQFGLIGSAFGIGYIVMTVIGGILVDRYGTKRMWTLSAIAWSLAIIAMGQAQGFTSLFILRVVLGLAEGSHFPTLVRAVATWLAPAHRTKAIAFGLMGVPVASIIGAPLTSFLIVETSWRWMFTILGGFGLIWALLWALTLHRVSEPMLRLPREVRESVRDSKEALSIASSDAPALRRRAEWKEILSNPAFLTTSFAFFALGYTVFFALIWLPGYFEKTHDTTIARTGWIVTLPWIISAIMVMAGGYFSDLIARKSGSLRRSRSFIIAGGLLASALCFASVPFFHSLRHDLLFISLGLGCIFFTNSPIFAINIDLFETKAATAEGLMAFFFSVAGILSPLLTGWLIGKGTNFDPALYVVGAISCVAALLVLFFDWPDRYAKGAI